MGCIMSNQKIPIPETHQSVSDLCQQLPSFHIDDRIHKIDLKITNFSTIIDEECVNKFRDIYKTIKTLNEHNNIFNEKINAFPRNSYGIRLEQIKYKMKDVHKLILSMAFVIFTFIKKNDKVNNTKEFRYFDKKSHELHIKLEKINLNENNKDVSSEDINFMIKIITFISHLLTSIDLREEDVVVMMILIDRLRLNKNFIFSKKTWKRCIIGVFILLSKISDDSSVWNEHVSRTLGKHPIADLNLLEKETLKLLDYDLSVSKQLYAIYYLHLSKLGSVARTSYFAVEGRTMTTSHLVNMIEVKRSTAFINPANNY